MSNIDPISPVEVPPAVPTLPQTVPAEPAEPNPEPRQPALPTVLATPNHPAPMPERFRTGASVSPDGSGTLGAVRHF